MVIVTGAGPQSNVMMPPAATALTTAAEVQLAGVPVPTVRLGRRVSTGRAAAGTAARPAGLPGFGSDVAAVARTADGDALAAADGTAGRGGVVAERAGAAASGAVSVWHALTGPALSRLSAAARRARRICTGRWYGPAGRRRIGDRMSGMRMAMGAEGTSATMVVLRSARPPPTAEMVGWTLTSYDQLQGLRASVRQVLEARLGRPGPAGDDVAERMTIVVTELASNALHHAGPSATVRLRETKAAFVVDVVDHRPSAPPRIAERRPGNVGGRGLRLTAELAHDCGWYAEDDAKHVWALFELPRRRRVSLKPRIPVPGLAAIIRRLRRLSH
jgi:anti-sigma regulatory factor (Ser/Thr protein kinase)